MFPPGTTGTIETLALDGKGGVFFAGDIAAMPIEGRPHNPGTFVKTDQYFWLQNWSYVIPFPAPVVESVFTYSFKVLVQVATVIVDGSALGWSYVSVGETANFTGQELAIDTGGGFPLVEVDLNPPNGLVQGQSAVQRSFVVGPAMFPQSLSSLDSRRACRGAGKSSSTTSRTASSSRDRTLVAKASWAFATIHCR